MRFHHLTFMYAKRVNSTDNQNKIYFLFCVRMQVSWSVFNLIFKAVFERKKNN